MSKISLAKELVAMGEPLSVNTLRGYSLERLQSMLNDRILAQRPEYGNPALAALRGTVNRCIAEGAPVYTEQVPYAALEQASVSDFEGQAATVDAAPVYEPPTIVHEQAASGTLSQWFALAMRPLGVLRGIVGV
jgi:hypothetical protein